MPDDTDTQLVALSHRPNMKSDEVRGVLPKENTAIIPPHRQAQSIKLARRVGQNQFSTKDASVFREPVLREVAEEIPIALVYNGISHVVLMATPQDYYDLAVGFSISEGIIGDATEIMRMECQQSKLGIEIHIDILARRLHDLQQRKRNAVGATGCGLCGIESLQQLEMGMVRQKPQFGSQFRHNIFSRPLATWISSKFLISRAIRSMPPLLPIARVRFNSCGRMLVAIMRWIN